MAQSISILRSFSNHILNQYFGFLCQFGPGFCVQSKNLQIVLEPSDFFCQLKERILKAQRRVVLSSLYWGTEPKPLELLDALKQSLTKSKDLSVTILLDYLRGTRNTSKTRGIITSSVTLLTSIINEFPEQVSAYFFHTPNLSGLWKKILPQRFNEVVGVQHIKCYLVDDDILISGANLSEQYFTNRQDRYMWINNSPSLADFYHKLILTIGSFSFSLNRNGQLRLHSFNNNEIVPDPTIDPENFKLFARQRMQDFLSNYKHDQMSNNEKNTNNNFTSHNFTFTPFKLFMDQTSEPQDTWLFPTIQIGPVGIDHDSKVTSYILQNAPPESTLHITSPYFNFSENYSDLILNGSSFVDVIVASPQTNGFWNSQGLSGYIPHAYRCVLQQFYSEVQQRHQENRITLYEYTKQGWTFHAKGLWLSLPQSSQNNHSNKNEKEEEEEEEEERVPLDVNTRVCCVSLIGSPNFGIRSVERDVESQVVILTENTNLQQRLKEEMQYIFQTGERVTNETFKRPQLKANLWVRLIIPFAKNFM